MDELGEVDVDCCEFVFAQLDLHDSQIALEEIFIQVSQLSHGGVEHFQVRIVYEKISWKGIYAHAVHSQILELV